MKPELQLVLISSETVSAVEVSRISALELMSLCLLMEHGYARSIQTSDCTVARPVMLARCGEKEEIAPVWLASIGVAVTVQTVMSGIDLILTH